MKALAASGEKGVLELMAATHAGMTTEQFSRIVAEWVAKAPHPRTRHASTEMVYQPMLELAGPPMQRVLRRYLFQTARSKISVRLDVKGIYR
jgi:hypothetical protein